MAKLGTIKVSFPEAVRSANIKVRVKLTGARSMPLRMWAAKWMIGVGMWLIYGHAEFVEADPPDDKGPEDQSLSFCAEPPVDCRLPGGGYQPRPTRKPPIPPADD